jgi:translocation and assembly module TamB
VAPALADGLSAVWDADLELAGAGARAYLSGEARLVRGSYTRDLSLLSLVSAGKPEAAADRPPALLLQVRVRLDDGLAVRNRAAQLRVGGAVSVEGTAAAPVLFGVLETRDGHVVFRGHRFTVTTASARFADPRRIEPLIEFVGTARIRAYDVTAELRGRPADLSVRLSSSPPLGQDDLLALVTFGVTRDEFRRSAGGVLAGEVGKLFVRELLGLPDDVGGMVGLDVLEVESGQGAHQQVRVGKQLTESALVVYSRSVSDSREQKLRIEYELGGPVLLSGEHDFRGSYGADVILRLRFR